MSKIFLGLLVAVWLGPSRVYSVCYEPFGCFELDSDFFNPITRPIYLLPQKPEDIQTKFFIYSKRIQSEEQCPGHLFNETTADPEPNTWPLCLITTEDLLNQTVLNQTLQAISDVQGDDDGNQMSWTAVLIHGWITGVNQSGFMYEIKNRLLHNSARQYDTVILVDWSQGADTLYTQACANIRLVGAEIAYFLRQLMGNVDGINVKNIHVLGHSLGAHTAGYVGSNFTGEEKIARVTALDPAGPLFDNQPKKVRVNEGDADFVDVIHTSGFYLSQIGLGMKNPTGHIDFYPNGGDDQPGCESTITQPLNKTSCDHARSHQLFLYSIPVENQPNNWCRFQSAQCSDWDDYKDNSCPAKNQCSTESAGVRLALCKHRANFNRALLPRQSEECANLGFFANEWAETIGLEGLQQLNSSVVMYLATTSVSPYC